MSEDDERATFVQVRQDLGDDHREGDLSILDIHWQAVIASNEQRRWHLGFEVLRSREGATDAAVDVALVTVVILA